MLGGIGPTELIILFLIGLMIVPVIIAIIDMIRRDDLDGTMKIFWLLVCVFLNIIGAIIYFVVGRRKK